MAFPTFTPPRNPDVTSSSTDTPRGRVIAYGDGYTKREIEGINGINRSRSLMFSALNQTDYHSIISFIEGMGYGAFYYAVPGQSMFKWYIKNYSHQNTNSSYYTITMNIEQVYDADG